MKHNKCPFTTVTVPVCLSVWCWPKTEVREKGEVNILPARQKSDQARHWWPCIAPFLQAVHLKHNADSLVRVSETAVSLVVSAFKGYRLMKCRFFNSKKSHTPILYSFLKKKFTTAEQKKHVIIRKFSGDLSANYFTQVIPVYAHKVWCRTQIISCKCN